MCGKVRSVPCCPRESRCTLLCIPCVALEILVYGHAHNNLLPLYGASRSP
jgi:hypothetical protein